MLFQDLSGEGVEVGAGRPRKRRARDPEQSRRLRDRALLLLQRAGLSLADMIEVFRAIISEPITDRTALRRRLIDAAKFAKAEAQASGLLKPV